ncbi:MAG: hypothetical protein ACHQFZ_09280 [Acidimicrobiales bacterium]
MAEIAGMAESMVIPMSKAQAGHVATYLSHNEDFTRGASLFVFETKEQAQAFSASMNLPPEAPVHIESFEVFEVFAHG